MIFEKIQAARIFLVDDQEANVRLLERILTRAGYTNFWSTTRSSLVPAEFEAQRPDLVVLDLQMPEMSGFEVMERIGGAIPENSYFPILVVTADLSSASKQRALTSGAKDFLLKPYDPIEAMLRIRNLLETRFLHLELKRYADELEARVLARTEELEMARIETLERLARAAEFRDDDTGQHARRVGELSAMLAQELGVDAATVELIRRAAPLHDVGKIGIPDAILLKPRALMAEEQAVIRTHTEIGAGILSGGSTPLILLAEEIARFHHERWDGTGYHALRGDAIPLVGRIVAVADTYDALTHERPYKTAWTAEAAMEEVRAQAGLQFDPTVVDALFRIRARRGDLIIETAV